jgi:hypothetical protein
VIDADAPPAHEVRGRREDPDSSFRGLENRG